MALYLTEEDVEKLLTMREAIEAVELALRELGENKAANTSRSRVHVADHVLNVLAAGTQTTATFGLKTYTTLADGTKPSSTLVWIYDARTGRLDAIVQATLLTRMRTGAASAVATKYLARKDARTLGLVGAGRIGEMQLAALLEDQRFAKVLIYDAVDAAASKLADAVRKKFSVESAQATSAAEVAAKADVLVTATFSAEPVLHGDMLQPGTQVNAVGSNSPARAELAKTCFAKANLVAVDYKEQCKLEAGDLMRAVESGATSWERVVELADLVTGHYRYARRDEDVTIFKSVGIAIEDVAVARRLCDKAHELGLGKELPVA
jgi:alanine dehydrogenase